MDKLRLHISFEAFPDTVNEKPQLAVSASVNDILVVEWWDLPVDMVALKESAIIGGKYSIWTCTCGIPMCAGLKEPIVVRHEGDTITWQGGVAPIKDFEKLVFDKALYQQTVADGWYRLQEEARWRKHMGVDFGVLLMSVDELLWPKGKKPDLSPQPAAKNANQKRKGKR